MSIAITVSGTRNLSINTTNHNHDTRYGWNNALGGFTDLIVDDNLTTGRLNDHIWFVNASDGGAAIQTAIDAASAGDIIVLGPGTFSCDTEQLLVQDDAKTLVGCGPNATTLTFGETPYGIRFRNANNCGLYNLTINHATTSVLTYTVSPQAGGTGGVAMMTGFEMRNVHINTTASWTGSAVHYGLYIYGASARIRDCIIAINGAASVRNCAIAVQTVNTEHQAGTCYVHLLGCDLDATTSSSYSYGLWSSAATDRDLIIDAHNCLIAASGGSVASRGVACVATPVTLSLIGGKIYGASNSVYQTAGTVQVIGALLDGTPSGTITYDGRVGAAELALSTGLGVFGTAPPAARQTYTATNVTTDRSFDADTVGIAELADVVGTLIADLRTYGLIA